MADRCCLVPGTGGNKLLANGADFGYPVLLQGAALLLARATGGIAPLVDLLSMEHADGQTAPVRTSLRPGTSVGPGRLLELAYNQVPADYERFTYDWRADIRHSAGQLVEFLVRGKPADGRWRLVAHSQGGLVAVAASKVYAAAVQPDGDNSRRFSELVRDLVLVGVPLHGTLNAAHALVHGEQLGASAAPDFVRVSRTWPALYQMLPAWTTSLGGAPPGGLLADSAWQHPDYASLDRSLLARARQARRQILDAPLDRMGGVAVTIYMARNRPTWDGAALDGDGRIAFPPRAAEGDSLVPYEATRSWMTPVEVGLTQASGPDEPIAEHSMLFTDPWVSSLFRGLLR